VRGCRGPRGGSEEKFKPFHLTPFSLTFSHLVAGTRFVPSDRIICLPFSILLTKRGVGGKATAMDLLGLLRAETRNWGPVYDLTYL
jgi:hypothetical protein